MKGRHVDGWPNSVIVSRLMSGPTIKLIFLANYTDAKPELGVLRLKTLVLGFFVSWLYGLVMSLFLSLAFDINDGHLQPHKPKCRSHGNFLKAHSSNWTF
jgi:hypothetical protein